ncbi:hypothetical protein [Armatimonas sp.]|uniref:hypothetical protein n=1 Tax=Armatimonas sp. TaxID=1872638 RepID=UPI0037529749
MNETENPLLSRMRDVASASQLGATAILETLTGLQATRTPATLELPNLYFAFRIGNWPPHKLLFKVLRRALLFPLLKRQVLFNQSVQNVLEGYRRELDAAHSFSHQASLRIAELEEQLAILKQEREETL